tara:strand:- start:10449 stop:13688 length:3240 start_codon:yes stop_codon:yes gene_type:complete
MTNHIIIGVGGTGGQVVASFRRRLYEHLKNIDPTSGTDNRDLLVDYLYVDTKPSDIEAATRTSIEQDPESGLDSLWRTQGRSVALEPSQTCLLEAHNFQFVLDNPEDFPNIHPWLGNSNLWKSEGRDDDVTAAGQIRRFGRYILARNCKLFDTQFEAAKARVRVRGHTTQSSQDAYKVHLIAGLAGGTGSGMFLDIIARIRALTSNDNNTKVLTYLLLPEREPPTDWETPRYRENGYAALSELNALMVNRFSPFDISGENSPIIANPPVDNAFIFTKVNKSGVSFAENPDTVPEIIGETIFQTVVLSGDATDRLTVDANSTNQASAKWQGALLGENYDRTAERDSAQKFDSSGTPIDSRSLRFLSFGMKRLAIPIREIEEDYTWSFIRSGLLQTLFNTWNDGLGYADRATTQVSPAVSVDPVLERELGLADVQLRLDEASLSGDNNDWQPAGRVFSNLLKPVLEPIARDRRSAAEKGTSGTVARFFQRLLGGGKTKTYQFTDLDAIERLTESAAQHFNNKFRENVGVEQFYHQRGQFVRDRSRQICDGIESYFFARWLAGELSLGDVISAIQNLRDRLQKKSKQIDLQKRQTLKDIEKSQESLDQLKAQIDKLNHGIGSLLASPSKSLGLIENFSENTAECFAKRCRNVALIYAGKLVVNLQEDLGKLGRDTDKVFALFRDGVANTQTRQTNLNLYQKSAVRDSYVKRMFDAERTEDTRDRLLGNREIQIELARILRDELRAVLAGRNSFGEIPNQFSAQSLVAYLQRPTLDYLTQSLSTKDAHLSEVLESKILERLYAEFNGRDDELKVRMRFWAEEAAPLIQFDENQVQLKGTSAPRSSFVVFLPKSLAEGPSQTTFDENLEDTIRQSLSQGTGTVEFVRTIDAAHEITFLQLTYMFPLRVLFLVNELGKHYKTAVDGPNGAWLKTQLNIEALPIDFPPLEKLTRIEARQDARKLWILAEAFELLHEVTPSSGEDTYSYVNYIDGDGEKNQKTVGSEISAGTRSIDEDGIAILRHLVNSEIGRLSKKMERDKFNRKLVEREETLAERYEGDIRNPEFLDERNAIREARELLRKKAFA